jgi:hypothetical protein
MQNNTGDNPLRVEDQLPQDVRQVQVLALKLRGEIVKLQQRLRNLEESLPIDAVISHMASVARENDRMPSGVEPLSKRVNILPGGAETMSERIAQIVDTPPDRLIELLYPYLASVLRRLQ